MQNSAIEWTTSTFNPWVGCSKVHAGCANCYAERDMDTRRGRVRWGPQGTRSKTSENYWKQPLQWNKAAEANGPYAERPRVFCASLCDIFEKWEGDVVDHQGRTLLIDEHYDPPRYSHEGGHRKATLGTLRRELFGLIDATPNLDWLLLTKRPENAPSMWPDGKQRNNVWIGTSVSNQETADEWIGRLLPCNVLARRLFLSIEPLLGPVDLGTGKIWCRHCLQFHDKACMDQSKPCFRWEAHLGDMIDWVIVGGESGPQSRPMQKQWVTSLRDQCQEAGIAFFFKQWGGVSKKEAGRLLEGRTWDELPLGA